MDSMQCSCQRCLKYLARLQRDYSLLENQRNLTVSSRDRLHRRYFSVQQQYLAHLVAAHLAVSSQ